MEEDIFSRVVSASEIAIQGAESLPFHRYLFDTVDAASTKFYNGIYGLRGVGKTVMLLQLASKRKRSVYITADATYLRKETLYGIVDHLISRGYENVFIDEIHSREGWATDLKTLYDEGKRNIFFSGSSAMEMKKGADLSRRAIMHELKPASFREYLNIKKGAALSSIGIGDLFDEEHRQKLTIANRRWKEFMQEYYRYGGVLYEDLRRAFPKPISNSLEKIISLDLASLRELDVKVENDIYKLLYKIAESGPYEASYSSLASYLGISKATAIRLLYDLGRVGLLKQVFPCGSGFRKEPKLYLRLPFRHALNEMAAGRTDVGAMREEFFVNNVDVDCYYKTQRGEKTPDFLVNGKTIEVGGASKKPSAADYLAIDGFDFSGNRIPLFLFGFLY